MLRWLISPVLIVIFILDAWDALAQYSPIGGHYAPMGNASGFGSGTVSLTGSYQTTVPLDLPPPRGDLPLPLAVVYDGGNQVGEAGLGWSVPFSYVMRSDTLSRRKPVFTFTDAPPKPAERVFLNMGGGSMLMNPTGVAHSYRPMVADTYLELREFSPENKWIVYDSAGRKYIFTSIDGLDDKSVWFLTEIIDRTSKNKIILKYDPSDVSTPTGVMFKELLLIEVSYSYNSLGVCPKHLIELVYCVPGEGDCGPGDGSILRYILDHRQARVRQKVLHKIKTWTNTKESCSKNPDNRLRNYHFFYEPDKDTSLPRLVKVDLQGKGPDSDGEPSLPVARYKYGSATINIGASPRFLLYSAAGSVQLPREVAEAPGAFSSMNEEGFRVHNTRQLFADFTGDGLPDYIDPGTPLGVPDHLSLVRNITDKSGTKLDGAILQPLFPPDSDLMVKAVSQQETLVARYSQHHQSNITDTSVQIIDWNGDGRLDIVDARGGKDSAGNSSPNYWRVLLNTPIPTTSDPERFRWYERQVIISHIRDTLENREPELLLPREYTPLARSQTSGRTESFGCRSYIYDETEGKFYLTACRDPLTGEQVEPYSVIRSGSTITEWKLGDLNGDGFPDLVFNSHGLRATRKDSETNKSSCFYSCPEETVDIPTGCRGECSDFEELGLPEHNHFLVFYNINGGGLSNPVSPIEFSAKWEVLLDDDDSCGVERWQELSPSQPGSQTMSCGFIEVNGDGLMDYATKKAFHGPWTALLNTGLPRDFPGGGFSETFAIELPGPPGSVMNSHFPVCEGESGPSPSPSPTPAPAGTNYHVSHRSALMDLTGDGIPDYVFLDDKQGSPSFGKWMVNVGTGTGFVSPVEIVSSVVPFEISLVEEQCKGKVSKTIAGMVDMDGDGRPDLVRAAEAIPGTPTTLRVRKLIGSSTTLGAHDAGHLISVDNGYGGKTLIEFGSAKTDTRTVHHLPFAEIVVTKTTTRTERGLGSSLEPARFSYGHAQMRYHPLLARWIFPGYGRHVVLMGLKTIATIDDAGEPERRLTGIAQVYDTISLSEASPLVFIPGYNSYALVGRVRDIHFLDGRFTEDPWELLNLDVTSDPRRHGNIHKDYETKLIPTSDDPNPKGHECYDVDPYPIYVLPSPEALQLCRRTGIVYNSMTTSWNGIEAPPSPKSIETRTSILNTDDLGRPLLVGFEHDTSRTDDDICLNLSYASSDSSDNKILDAVHTARLNNCIAVQSGFFAGMRFRYDNLPEGKVSTGLLSHRIVERYNAESSAALETYVLDVLDHDEFGNVVSVTLAKKDGAVRIRTIEYDPFGIVPEGIVESSGGTDFAVGFNYDPVSLLPLSVIDSNNIELRNYYDKFDRPLLSTFVTYPDKLEYVLSKSEYLGDNPSDTAGRRIRDMVFHSLILKESLTDAALHLPDVTASSAYFDELGRLRFIENPLGSDYSDKTLVTQFAEYDGLGRLRFTTAPFQWSDPPASRYGTSYHYYPDNRIQCLIDGEGPQPLTFTTNTSLDRYPMCFNYSFVDHQAVTHFKGPNELLPSSSQAGAYDEVRATAIGSLVSASRLKGSIRLDFADYKYNRLGDLIQIRRWKNPFIAGAGHVSWSFLYDSLGQLLEIQEPRVSTRKQTYDEWGNLFESTWLDTSFTPTVTRGSRNTNDGFGRLIKVEQTIDGIADPKFTLKYFYDSPSEDPNHLSPTNLRGRLSYASDETMNTFFGYDSLGRLTSVSRVNINDPEKRRFFEERMYTPSGQLTSLGFRLPDTGEDIEKANYYYDSARRLLGVTWMDRLATSSLFQAAEIDPLGRYLDVNLGNGVSEKYTYRTNRRRDLQKQIITNETDTRTISFVGYDGANRLEARKEQVRKGLFDFFPATEKTDYTYNTLNQLVRAKTRRSGLFFSSRVRDESFIYDALGNLYKTNDHVGLNSLKFNQDVQDPDRLCRRDQVPFIPGSPDMVPIPGLESVSCTYLYDTLGNVVEIKDTPESSRSFTYDTQSRLIAMLNGSVAAEIRYDAFDNVSELDLTDSTTGESRQDRRYGALVEETEFVFETEEPPTIKRVIERRIPGPMGIIAVRRGFGEKAEVIYQHGDFNANRLFTDEEGKIVQGVDYSSYGTINKDTGDDGSVKYTKYLWNGGETFKQFGIKHLGARAYDPVSGRFLQRDPLFIPRAASQTNPYAFGFGDPVNFTDPTGLDAGGCDVLAPGCSAPLPFSGWFPSSPGVGEIGAGSSINVEEPKFLDPNVSVLSNNRIPIFTYTGSVKSEPWYNAPLGFGKQYLKLSFRAGRRMVRGLSYVIPGYGQYAAFVDGVALYSSIYDAAKEDGAIGVINVVNPLDDLFISVHQSYVAFQEGRYMSAGEHSADAFSHGVNTIGLTGGLARLFRPKGSVTGEPDLGGPRGSSSSFDTMGTERVAGYGIVGSKGLIGNVFERRILIIERIRGPGFDKTGRGGLFRAFESEALAAGAKELRILLFQITNEKLFNPGWAQPFGYSFRRWGQNVELQKGLVK